MTISGCLDSQTSGDIGKGGIFTHAMLLAIDKLSQAMNQGTLKEQDYSVGHLYNVTLRQKQKYFENASQQISVEHSRACPNDAMCWPLIPQGLYNAPLHQSRNRNLSERGLSSGAPPPGVPPNVHAACSDPVGCGALEEDDFKPVELGFTRPIHAQTLYSDPTQKAPRNVKRSGGGHPSDGGAPSAAAAASWGQQAFGPRHPSAQSSSSAAAQWDFESSSSASHDEPTGTGIVGAAGHMKEQRVDSEDAASSATDAGSTAGPMAVGGAGEAPAVAPDAGSRRPRASASEPTRATPQGRRTPQSEEEGDVSSGTSACNAWLGSPERTME